MKPSVSSLYQAIELKQDIPPLLIGERCNTNGSKKFKELLLAEDFDGCLQVALDQEAAEKLLALIDQLEDLDDVQAVYSNADISEAVLAEL